MNHSQNNEHIHHRKVFFHTFTILFSLEWIEIMLLQKVKTKKGRKRGVREAEREKGKYGYRLNCTYDIDEIVYINKINN